MVDRIPMSRHDGRDRQQGSIIIKEQPRQILGDDLDPLLRRNQRCPLYLIPLYHDQSKRPPTRGKRDILEEW